MLNISIYIIYSPPAKRSGEGSTLAGLLEGLTGGGYSVSSSDKKIKALAAKNLFTAVGHQVLTPLGDGKDAINFLRVKMCAEHFQTINVLSEKQLSAYFAMLDVSENASEGLHISQFTQTGVINTSAELRLAIEDFVYIVDKVREIGEGKDAAIMAGVMSQWTTSLSHTHEHNICVLPIAFLVSTFMKKLLTMKVFSIFHSLYFSFRYDIN